MEKKPDARQIFVKRLHSLATRQGFSLNDLALALNLRGDRRKWLTRVWTYGLVRPDRRRARLLNRLARHLGLKSSSELWEPNAEPKLKVIAQDQDHAQEWLGLVEAVKIAMIADEYLTARGERTWGRAVADFARSIFLKRNGKDADTVIRQRLYDEWGLLIGSPSMETIRQEAFNRMQAMPQWAAFMQNVNEVVGGDAKQAKQLLDNCWKEVVLATPSEDELVDRFVNRFLGKPETTEEDELHEAPKPLPRSGSRAARRNDD